MQELSTMLKKVIHDLYGLDFDPDITPSPENIDADYSSNAPLKLAKELHKSPMQIAEEILEELKKYAFEEHNRRRGDYGATEPRNDGSEGAFRESIFLSSPGFLNFILSDDYLSSAIDDFDGNFTSDELKGQTIICEFSDPNPFKILHVGHLYTSIVGDSIGRLYEYASANVIRANFGGDVGLHVAKTMYALEKDKKPDFTIEDISNSYIEGTRLYEEDETAKSEIAELNKKIYQINLEKLHDTTLAEDYWRGRELSYDYFRDFYDSIGVKFDKYYPESTVADLGLKKVKEQLENGVYEYSDGAVIFNGEKFGLHTRVFINNKGVPTYETKDVGLIFTKWQDYHFDKSVVITGSEQTDYMKVVLKSIEQYAPELVERTTHLTHGLVKLPGGVKMSSRKGNILKAVDVIDLVRQELKNTYNSSDEKVIIAAIKYAFLKYKMGGNIIFDPEESVKMTGNSGPYLLYSCVRAKKILGNVRAQDEGLETVSREGHDPSEVSEPRNDGRERTGSRDLHSSERALAKKILEYKKVLAESVVEMAPHKVANFLYELAQEFSRFYEKCPVSGSDREEERLKLVKAYLDTMTHGLGLLGISIPDSM